MSITNVGPRPTMPGRIPTPVPMANAVLPAVNTPVAAPEAQPAATRASARDAFVAPRTSTPTRLESFISKGNVLRFGASGPEVLDLQKFLGMKTVEQDSDFGPRTTQALKSFQRAHGMDPDGVVGPATLAQLKRAGQPRNDGALLKSAVDGGKVFGVGDRGAEVRALQRLVGMPAAAQDGVYGLATREAVGAFQRSRLGMNSQSSGYGQFGPTTHKAATSTSTTPVPTTPVVSPAARAQMDRLVNHALNTHEGASRGDCYRKVADYIDQVGYGKLGGANGPTVLQAMPNHIQYARDFAVFMNTGDNAAKYGLKRLDLTNPYDAPKGAIVVVGPRSPGTAHPVAGDIAVARGDGFFVNDGPRMNYGPRSRFIQDGGRVLGIYVPA